MSGQAVATVPPRAAQWIVRVLREAGMPSVPFQSAMGESPSSHVELRLLTVRHLKKISNEMSSRTTNFRIVNPSAPNDLTYFPPKSGARKAEWISAIAQYFRLHGSNCNIYNIMNGVPASIPSQASPARGASGSPSSARKRRASPARAAVRESPFNARDRAAAAAMARAASSHSSASNRAAVAASRSPARDRSAAPHANSAAVAADEALARSLQSKFMQEDLGLVAGQIQCNQHVGTNSHQPWGGPLTNSSLMNRMPAPAAPGGAVSTMGNGGAAGGSKSDNSDSKPKHLPVKVKKEPIHSGAANASASSSSSGGNCLRPRDERESGMAASLREMGFADTREILTALRAVVADREEVSAVMPGSVTGIGGGWSELEQVEAAMMWIVTQREEAAEAQKLDEARISSERADAAMEQSRKRAMERELKNAPAVDLIGSWDRNESTETRSKHFPSSVLLRNRAVREVLGVAAKSPGKDQVIRLLSLEKRARKWYGTVLPFSYFEHFLGPRLEGWAGEPARLACGRLREQSDELERAMFNLSEQVEGGFGYVPKIFVDAQKDATENGKPTSAEETNAGRDDDVEMLPSMASSSRRTEGGKSVEVVDIT